MLRSLVGSEMCIRDRGVREGLSGCRYYAGNWPISIWMVKSSAYHKLSKLRSIGATSDHLWLVLGREGVVYTEAKLLGWMALHLQGRALPKLLPLAIPNDSTFNDYHVTLGEMYASFGTGYNFGDGYLHGSFLLHEFQQRCGFEPGDLRQIFIDSCPLFGKEYQWWIRDATDAFNSLQHGTIPISQLVNAQPF
eukprot:TRINITY_DN54592_c0_g1_i1.p1 TRINITY_DN54592_c0_g1~~TRINITY_DN54592_c0_g1_i1.p1  ORF type:complete len:193 (+),score=36.21 TRINITY_DN54592_c0_g1_i1:126-704(+)